MHNVIFRNRGICGVTAHFVLQPITKIKSSIKVETLKNNSINNNYNNYSNVFVVDNTHGKNNIINMQKLYAFCTNITYNKYFKKVYSTSRRLGKETILSK